MIRDMTVASDDGRPSIAIIDSTSRDGLRDSIDAKNDSSTCLIVSTGTATLAVGTQTMYSPGTSCDSR